MTGEGWLAIVCLIGAAALTAWSPAGNRARWRALASAPAEAGRREGNGRWVRTGRKVGPGWRGSSRQWVERRPGRFVLAVAGLVATVGAVLGGPVAAAAGLAYGGLVARAVWRRQIVRSVEQSRRRQLDSLVGLAADLRAGLPVAPVSAPTTSPARGKVASPAERIDELVRAAVRLAEQTGAPLADLLERIEADARAMDRGLAAAAAQAAGARATAMLLAGLPLGGIALGYGIGVDPLAVLLRTPIGAACAIGAIVLQLAGLAWADRLSTSARRAT
ncbi:type II secretion system F family protein [Micromonospora sp. NPDC050417]|uniref:type II secretion system F family protein n=1 Tax=Micromonospora sp. NPDC050417 TaxID=3364280 RepID=UPI003787F09E